MLSSIKPVAHILTVVVLLGFGAFAQSADITGWQGLPWGNTKTAALKAFQPFHIHECRSTAETVCASDPGELIIDDYRSNGVSYRVSLKFDGTYRLSRVTMTSLDNRESFAKALAELTGRYGKPGLRSEYDGDQEITRTKWNWVKPHGSVSLASEDGDDSNGLLTITYQARPDGSRK